MPNLRILCLDDESTTLKVLTLGLGSTLEEADVETCEDSQVALEKLESNTYDILITDLHMPEINGLQVIEKLKQKGCNTEVIVLTADVEIRTVVEAMAKGARDYIAKPISIPLLIEKIEVIRQERKALSLACEAEAGLRAIEAQAQSTISDLSRELSFRDETISSALEAIEKGKDLDEIKSILLKSRV